MRIAIISTYTHPTRLHEIQTRMRWNTNFLGLMEDAFVFLDNNLGGLAQVPA